MVRLPKYHGRKYTCADTMRALAGILRKANVTDGQTQYCIKLYKLFHLRGIRMYENSGSDFRVRDEEFGTRVRPLSISKFKLELKLKSSCSLSLPLVSFHHALFFLCHPHSHPFSTVARTRCTNPYPNIAFKTKTSWS